MSETTLLRPAVRNPRVVLVAVGGRWCCLAQTEQTSGGPRSVVVGGAFTHVRHQAHDEGSTREFCCALGWGSGAVVSSPDAPWGSEGEPKLSVMKTRRCRRRILLFDGLARTLRTHSQQRSRPLACDEYGPEASHI